MSLEKDVLDTLMLIKRPYVVDSSGTTNVISTGYDICDMPETKKNYFANVLRTISDYLPLVDSNMVQELSTLIHASKFSYKDLSSITEAYTRALGPADNLVIPQGPRRANLLMLALSGGARNFDVNRLKQETYFRKNYQAYVHAMIELDWQEGEKALIERIKRNSKGILGDIPVFYKNGKILKGDYFDLYRKLKRMVPKYISKKDFKILPAPG